MAFSGINRICPFWNFSRFLFDKESTAYKEYRQCVKNIKNEIRGAKETIIKAEDIYEPEMALEECEFKEDHNIKNEYQNKNEYQIKNDYQVRQLKLLSKNYLKTIEKI